MSVLLQMGGFALAATAWYALFRVLYIQSTTADVRGEG